MITLESEAGNFDIIPETLIIMIAILQDPYENLVDIPSQQIQCLYFPEKLLILIDNLIPLQVMCIFSLVVLNMISSFPDVLKFHYKLLKRIYF